MSFSRRGLAILGLIMLSVVLLTTTSEAFHGRFFGELEGGADLAVTKSGPDTVPAGSDVTFTVTVTNLGPEAAAEITLNDVIPAGLTFQSLDETNDPEFFTCTTPMVGDGGSISCTAPTMPSGAISTFTIVLHVPADAQPGTTFTNSATASSALDPNDENNSGVAGFTIPGAPMADLSASKTAPTNALPGGDVSFVIMISNVGPTAAEVVKFTDALPGNLTFVSITQNDGAAFSCTTPAPGDPQIVTCTRAIMDAGTTASFTLTAHIPAESAGTQYTNTVTVTSDTPDPNEENNSASTTVTASSADVGVTKTGPASATAGDNISWTITFTNAGPEAVINAVFTDSLPNGTTFVSFDQDNGPPATCGKPPVGGTGVVTCSISPFAAESSAQFTLTAKIGNTTSITNTVTASAESADPNSNNNSASVTTTVTPLADLSVNKTDSPDPVFAGTDLTYTVTINNAGPSDAQNTSLVDTVPANTTFVSAQQTSGPTFTCNTPAAGGTGNVSCSIASFALNASATFQIVVRVGPNLTSGTIINNTATISSTTADTNSNNNESSTTTVVSAQANLSLTKSDTPDPVLADQNITYTLGFTNSGPSSAQSVAVTDAVPTNTTFVSAEVTSGSGWTTTTPPVGGTGDVVFSKGSVISGETAVFKIVVKVNVAAPNGSQISNTAVASSTTADPDSNNNQSSTTTTVSVEANLSLTKSDTPDPVLAGQNITYTLGLNNSGPSSAQTVAVTDAVPTNTTFVSAEVTSGSGWATTMPPVGGTGNVVFSKGTVISGETAAFKIVVNVNPAAPHGSQISNTAVASSTTTDPDSNNNTATATTQVVSKPDLTISKTHTGNFSPGQMGATYTIRVSNVDTGPSSGVVTVTDVVPVGLTPTGPAFANGWSCSINGQTFTCTRSDVLAGGASYPDILLTVNVANPAPLSVTNTATISGGNDSNPANNSASDVTNINCSVDSSLNNPNPLMISRFRENGPNGPTDEFIEIYNPATTPHTVSAGNCTGGYSVISSTGNGNSSNAALQVCQIPNGTVIPAGGYYLCTGVTYSLNNLGLNGGAEGATATGDALIGCGGQCVADVPDDAGLALLDVGSTGINLCQPGTIGCPTGFNYSSIAGNGNARVFDSVGFGPYGPGAPAPARPSLAGIFCEGTCLQPVGDASTAANCANQTGLFPAVAVPPACYGQAGQYELLRRQTTFDPLLGTVHHDTNNNANDFIFLAPNSAINMGLHLTGVSGVSAVLGASVPQNSTAPADIPRPSFTQAPFDAGANQLGPRNAERKYALDPTVANTANDPLGTFTLRYRYTNNSGRPLFPIRFRVDNLATLCGPQNAASVVGTGDARNLASPGDCAAGSFTALLKLLNSKKEIVVDSEGTVREVFGTVMDDLSVGAPAAPGPLSPFGGGIDNTVIINGSANDASVGDGVTGGTGIYNVVSFKDPPANVIRIGIKFGVVRSGRFILLLTPVAKPGPTPLPD